MLQPETHHFLGERYKTGFSCIFHPSSGASSLIPWLVCSWQQGESLGLLTSFFLSVCLASWQLPRVTAVVRDPFFMFCTQSRSGNPLCAVTFLQSAGSSIQPSIHTYMHTGTSYVFIFIHLSFSLHLTNCYFSCAIPM